MMDKQTGLATLLCGQHRYHAAKWNLISKEARNPAGQVLFQLSCITKENKTNFGPAEMHVNNH